MGAKAGIRIEEIRQRLENTGVYDKGTIDALLGSLRERYGDEVPAVEVVKRLCDVPLPTPAAETAQSSGAKTPGGISFELTPGGFLLRASCRSFAGGLVGVVFAGVLTAIPFLLWGDLIRGVRTDEGVNWPITAFLAIWAGVVLYVAATAAYSFFGEIRIVKEGDSGEIFSGIGRIGRTHRLKWSEFNGAGQRDVAAYSSGTTSHTRHYVELSGTPRGYKFGPELSAERQAFVIAFLRERVFGKIPR